jgi:hypothetical protein
MLVHDTKYFPATLQVKAQAVQLPPLGMNSFVAQSTQLLSSVVEPSTATSPAGQEP